MRIVILVLTLAACGKVPALNDAAIADTGSDGPIDALVCGDAGQSCCANEVCSTGLRCTASDQVCRSAEIWFGGTNGFQTGTAYVGHGDGTTFTLTPIGTGAVGSIYGTSADDVWVVGLGPTNANNQQTSWFRHWDGATWAPPVEFAGYTVNGLWGNTPDNYWAVTNAGGVMHWNGASWSFPNVIAPGVVFTQIWGMSDSDVWAFGDNRVAHWDGSAWSVTTRTDFAANSGAVTGVGQRVFSGGVVEGTKPAVLMRNGSEVTVGILGDGLDCATPRGLWVGLDDAWAITSSIVGGAQCDVTPTLVRYENGVWTRIGKLPGAASASYMWGTSNRDLFATGSTPDGMVSLFHHDGMTWSPAFTSTEVIYVSGIWGTGRVP